MKYWDSPSLLESIVCKRVLKNWRCWKNTEHSQSASKWYCGQFISRNSSNRQHLELVVCTISVASEVRMD